MPKERLHMLIAEESFRASRSGSRSTTRLPEAIRTAFLFGAISPDIFFYDLPFCRLDAVGDALHRLEGEAGLLFFKGLIEEEKKNLPAVVEAWMLGMTCHFLTDGLWHPVIREFSSSTDGLCHDLKLSEKSCHQWLESELEAFWLARMGPRDAYIPLLRRFGRERELIRTCATYFRKIMVRLGIKPVPTEARIRRCFYWQNLSLRQFSRPVLMRRRSWLLAKKSGRFLGALVVPIKPGVPGLLSSEIAGNRVAEILCDEKFMAKTVKLLAGRSYELPVRL
ncbi:MAG: zinc dependent phospholipase C family protein [Syntrophobacteraceae bacterium]